MAITVTLLLERHIARAARVEDAVALAARHAQVLDVQVELLVAGGVVAHVAHRAPGAPQLGRYAATTATTAGAGVRRRALRRHRGRVGAHTMTVTVMTIVGT